MKPLIKILSTVVSVLGGFLGSKLLEALWGQLTGDEPPKTKNKEALRRQPLLRVVGFAAASSATSALIKAATERGARKLEARTKHSAEEV